MNWTVGWLIEFAKALPIVAVTAVVAAIPAFIGIGNSKATGLAAVLGMAAPTLICAGILNLALGLFLWRLVISWVAR
jgi:hypothetical protein